MTRVRHAGGLASPGHHGCGEEAGLQPSAPRPRARLFAQRLQSGAQGAFPQCAYRDRGLPRSSTKYLSSDQRKLYPEFQGDTRDQRSYLAWSTLWLGRARELVAPGGLISVFSDWRQLPVTTDALQCGGWVWRGVVPWDKTESSRPQLGRYRNQAEYVVWGSNGARPLAGVVAPGVMRHCVPRKKHHIAGKPIGLMTDLLRPMEGPILDPFMGSATIGVACLQLGLPYVGIEVDETYFAIACQRMEEAVNG